MTFSEAFLSVILYIKAVNQTFMGEPEPVPYLYQLINNYRGDNNKAKLTIDNELATLAQTRAEAIQRGEFPPNHDHFLYDISIRYCDNKKDCYMGENLAENFDSSVKVYYAWRKSPSHNEVLLSDNPCRMGIGNKNDVWVLLTSCYEN